MELRGSSETLLNFYHNTSGHITAENNLQGIS